MSAKCVRLVKLDSRRRFFVQSSFEMTWNAPVMICNFLIYGIMGNMAVDRALRSQIHCGPSTRQNGVSEPLSFQLPLYPSLRTRVSMKLRKEQFGLVISRINTV